MGFNELIGKLFGNKNTRDMREIQPWVEKIKKAGLRVAIDPMYGVSQSSLRTILLTCRCDVDVIREQHDTLFGGRMPAPSEEAQRLLSVYVTDHRCDMGIGVTPEQDGVRYDVHEREAEHERRCD